MASPVWSDDEKLSDSSCVLASSDDETFVFTPKKRRYRRSLFERKRRRQTNSRAAEIINKDKTLNKDCVDCNNNDNRHNVDMDDSFNDEITENEDSVRNTSIAASSSLDNLTSSSNLPFSENSSDLSISDTNESFDSGEEHEMPDYKNSDELLYCGSSHTRLTSFVSIMLYVMKHSVTKEGFSDLLMLIQSHLPKSCPFTTSVYRLKEFLKSYLDFQEPEKHYLCTTCGDILQEGKQCEKRSCRLLNSKSNTFHDLRLEVQLGKLFKDNLFCKLVLDRKSEVATRDQNNHRLTDIIDGSEHQRLTRLPNIVPEEKRITFTMNTDGVALFSSSHKGSLWPVYLAVNELPVKLRFSKKYLITSHLYCLPEKPNMLTYLMPLMNILKRLDSEGLKVDVENKQSLVRCHLLAVALDLPARAEVLNMKYFNGKYGCSYCFDAGTNPPNRPMIRYYPFDEQSIPRTHHSMVNDANIATGSTEAENGVKGANPLIVLNYVDLPRTFVIDWMHSVLLGVVKTLLTLWCDRTYKGKTFYIGDKIALINRRLMDVKVPDFISRQQRQLEDYKHWKASECKEWLFHYSVPVLSGIQDNEIIIHYSLLVTGVFLLNKESVANEDIDAAEGCLNDFCRLFPVYYDCNKQTMNVHLLRHLAQFVRLHGPLFQYSCFTPTSIAKKQLQWSWHDWAINLGKPAKTLKTGDRCRSGFGFEAMNSHLKKMVHGTRFINNQISFAIGMAKCLPDLVKSVKDKADETVKKLVQRLSNTIVREHGDSSVRGLGARKNHVLTDAEQDLLAVDGEQHEQLYKYFRVQTVNNQVIYSKEYKRVKNKNSYTVIYVKDDNQQENKYGSVEYFLEISGNIYYTVQ